MRPAITRTLDAQGRIILPIEIRKTMGLSDGDAIEIRPVENGVLLSKYISAAGDQALKKYLNTLYATTKCGVAICSEEEVLMSKGIYLPEGTEITTEISDAIHNGKTILFSEDVYATASKLSLVDTLIPLISPDLFWQPTALLLFRNKKTSIGEQERICARLMAALLTSQN